MGKPSPVKRGEKRRDVARALLKKATKSSVAPRRPPVVSKVGRRGPGPASRPLSERGGRPPLRGKKIYVGDLLETVTGDDLHREFSRFGKIRESWIAHNPPGFGFVDFVYAEDGMKAVERLNGRNVLGSRIRVELAKSTGPKSGLDMQMKRLEREARLFPKPGLGRPRGRTPPRLPSLGGLGGRRGLRLTPSPPPFSRSTLAKLVAARKDFPLPPLPLLEPWEEARIRERRLQGRSSTWDRRSRSPPFLPLPPLPSLSPSRFRGRSRSPVNRSRSSPFGGYKGRSKDPISSRLSRDGRGYPPPPPPPLMPPPLMGSRILTPPGRSKMIRSSWSRSPSPRPKSMRPYSPDNRVTKRPRSPEIKGKYRAISSDRGRGDYRSGKGPVSPPGPPPRRSGSPYSPPRNSRNAKSYNSPRRSTSPYDRNWSQNSRIPPRRGPPLTPSPPPRRSRNNASPQRNYSPPPQQTSKSSSNKLPRRRSFTPEKVVKRPRAWSSGSDYSPPPRSAKPRSPSWDRNQGGYLSDGPAPPKRKPAYSRSPVNRANSPPQKSYSPKGNRKQTQGRSPNYRGQRSPSPRYSSPPRGVTSRGRSPPKKNRNSIYRSPSPPARYSPVRGRSPAARRQSLSPRGRSPRSRRNSSRSPPPRQQSPYSRGRSPPRRRSSFSPSPPQRNRSPSPPPRGKNNYSSRNRYSPGPRTPPPKKSSTVRGQNSRARSPPPRTRSPPQQRGRSRSPRGRSPYQNRRSPSPRNWSPRNSPPRKTSQTRPRSPKPVRGSRKRSRSPRGRY